MHRFRKTHFRPRPKFIHKLPPIVLNQTEFVTIQPEPIETLSPSSTTELPVVVQDPQESGVFLEELNALAAPQVQFRQLVDEPAPVLVEEPSSALKFQVFEAVPQDPSQLL